MTAERRTSLLVGGTSAAIDCIDGVKRRFIGFGFFIFTRFDPFNVRFRGILRGF